MNLIKCSLNDLDIGKKQEYAVSDQENIESVWRVSLEPTFPPIFVIGEEAGDLELAASPPPGLHSAVRLRGKYAEELHPAQLWLTARVPVPSEKTYKLTWYDTSDQRLPLNSYEYRCVLLYVDRGGKISDTIHDCVYSTNARGWTRREVKFYSHDFTEVSIQFLRTTTLDDMGPVITMVSIEEAPPASDHTDQVVQLKKIEGDKQVVSMEAAYFPQVLEVQALDAAGGAVSGANIHFTVTGNPGPNVESSSVISNPDNGYAVAQVKPGKASGKFTVTATANGKSQDFSLIVLPENNNLYIAANNSTPPQTISLTQNQSKTLSFELRERGTNSMWPYVHFNARIISDTAESHITFSGGRRELNNLSTDDHGTVSIELVAGLFDPAHATGMILSIRVTENNMGIDIPLTLSKVFSD